MTYHLHPEKLSRLSTRLEELFAKVSVYGGRGPLPPDLADEIAATAGEVMVELADQRGDRLARQVIEDARRLREAARTIRPEPARIAESGRALVSDLELVIREDRRAA
jgi:molybdopterin-biosynthesis enzyme MoeA-like protein